MRIQYTNSTSKSDTRLHIWAKNQQELYVWAVEFASQTSKFKTHLFLALRKPILLEQSLIYSQKLDLKADRERIKMRPHVTNLQPLHLI